MSERPTPVAPVAPAAAWLCPPVISPGHPVDHQQALLAYHPDAPNGEGLAVRMRLLDSSVALTLDVKHFTRPVALPGMLVPGVMGYPVPWTLEAGQSVIAEAAFRDLESGESSPSNGVAFRASDGKRHNEITCGVSDIASLRGIDDARVVVDLAGKTAASDEIGRVRCRELCLTNGRVVVDGNWLPGFDGQTFEARGVDFFSRYEARSTRPVAPAFRSRFIGCTADGFVDSFRGADLVLNCVSKDCAGDAFSDNAVCVSCIAEGVGGRGGGHHADLIQFYARPNPDGTFTKRNQAIYDSVIGRKVLGQTIMMDSVEFGALVLRNIVSDSRTAEAGGDSPGRKSHIMSRAEWMLIEGLSMPGSTLNFRMAAGPRGQGRVVVRDSLVWAVNAGNTRENEPGELRPEWLRNVVELSKHAPAGGAA